MTDLTGLVNKRYNAAKEARRMYDRNAKLNLAFYCGKQWVVYDTNLRRVVEWFPNRVKPRPTINLVMPVVRQEFATLTADAPTFNVVSSNAGQDNITTAKAAYQFLDAKSRIDRYWDTTAEALHWAIICADGFIKVYYDPMAGPQLNGEPLGDVKIDSCGPLEIFVDPSGRDLDSVKWLIHARVRSLEYIQEKFGVKVPSEQTEVASFSGSFGAYSLYGPWRSAIVEHAVPSAVVKEYWERPSFSVPEGRYVVVAGTNILHEGPNPYADICPIPFAKVTQIPVPGMFFGESSVTHLRPINVLYNKFRGDVLENAARLTTPPLLVPSGAFLKPPEFAPGEIVYYKPNIPGRIDQVQVNPYPPQLMNTLMRLLQERDDISGLSEVSRGAIPRGLRTPEQFAQVLKQDMVRLAVTARNYEKMIADTLNMVLKLARKFYTIPRLIQIMGVNNSYEVALFKGTNIPEDAQIFVEAGSTMAFTRDQKQAHIMSLWDRQLITDPRLVLRLSSYGSVEELTQDTNLDTSQAQRENRKLALGGQPPVEPYQNHVLHIVEHNRFRKTVEYEALSPEIQQLFTMHTAQHEQLLPAMPPPPPAPIIVQAAQQGGVQVGQRPRRPRSPFGR